MKVETRLCRKRRAPLFELIRLPGLLSQLLQLRNNKQLIRLQPQIKTTIEKGGEKIFNWNITRCLRDSRTKPSPLKKTNAWHRVIFTSLFSFVPCFIFIMFLKHFYVLLVSSSFHHVVSLRTPSNIYANTTGIFYEVF